MDYARRQTSPSGMAPQDHTHGKVHNGGHAAAIEEIGCTATCTSVIPTYYPHDAGHEIAARAIETVLLAAPHPTHTAQVRSTPYRQSASRSIQHETGRKQVCCKCLVHIASLLISFILSRPRAYTYAAPRGEFSCIHTRLLPRGWSQLLPLRVGVPRASRL